MQGIMYNEYHIKSLLMRDDIDFTKFNKNELIDFLDIAAKELKTYKEKCESQDKQVKLVEYALEHNVDYVYVLEDLLKLLKGQEIKMDLESYLD